MLFSEDNVLFTSSKTSKNSANWPICSHSYSSKDSFLISLSFKANVSSAIRLYTAFQAATDFGKQEQPAKQAA